MKLIFYPIEDIFLFFSALGLCFSYNKNSLRHFYLNRVKRIIPLFLLLALFRIGWQFWIGKYVSLWDVMVTITGLSYFKVFGGIWVDWYLCSLLILYATFPFIYKYVMKMAWKGIIIISCISSILCLTIPLYWEHACIIGRLPVFCDGILFYFIAVRKEISMNKNLLIGLVLYGVCLFVIDIFIPNDRTRFLTPSFLLPIIIITISCLHFKKINNWEYCVSFIGLHSLEIYIANCFTISICHKQGLNLAGLLGAFIEIIVIIVLSITLYYVNRFITVYAFKQKGYYCKDLNLLM